MIACGDLGSLAEARTLIRNSFEIAEFMPRDAVVWDGKAAHFDLILPSS
jgi:hypothetical protein